jgi:hypothetical protein
MEETAMASVSKFGPLNVDQLVEAVERLSPVERQAFQLRLVARQGENGDSSMDEETLVRAALARLPEAAERRRRRLIARSEQGRLTPKELTEYQSLAQEALRIDAARAEALASLARRRGQSVRAVKAAIEREGRANGAGSDSAGGPTASTRSRRRPLRILPAFRRLLMCAFSYVSMSSRGQAAPGIRRLNWPGLALRATVTNTPRPMLPIRKAGG